MINAIKNLSLSSKILIGVALGVGVGLTFGYRVSFFSILGDVFIGLLQMTVLPYIMFSLIVNIGRLSLDEGKKLIRYGLLFLGVLLGIGIIGLAFLPLAFPIRETGSFYSADFIQTAPPFDFVGNYIPANPFKSMSDNTVPAVVLFSIFVGLGVMKLPGKESLLQPLDVLNTGLNQVNKMVVKITPIGVFCIAVGVVSELSLADLKQIEAYLLIYLLAVVLLTFLVLPLVISALTPFSPKTVFKFTRSTLITIFATGKIIVVFPQLIENIKEIVKNHEPDSSQQLKDVDIVMPLAYPFPNLGTFMIFVFVPFAGWFTGSILQVEDYPIFLSSTLLSSFVAPITGLPFSMDLMGIKQDAFQLFVVSSVLTDRIRVVLGAFHLITLTLLTISATAGWFKFNFKRIIPGVLVSVFITVAGIIGTRFILNQNMKTLPTNREVINEFKLINPAQPFTIKTSSTPNPKRKWRGENTLSRIKRTEKLRVGFYANAIPFTFFNQDTALVGLGVELAHLLAADLKAELVFVPIAAGTMLDGLRNDHYDIVMSDIFISSHYPQEIEISSPYLDVSLALLVKQDNKALTTFERAIELDTFTIAYFERADIARDFQSFFPHAGVFPIDSFSTFFNGVVDSVTLDAYLTSAERAAALTVFYPDYKVVNPLPYHINNGLVYPLANDEVWRKYINNWLGFRKQDGSIEKVYKQWVLGIPHEVEEPNWNVIDNIINPRLEED